MKPTPQMYAKMANEASPPSSYIKNMIFAFGSGGAICTVGQWLFQWYSTLGLDEITARATVSITLVGAVALFTALNVYDDFAAVAGAGSLVPITGFANAMVSPAVEFKQEGFVMGVGAKMFIIAGPVIVYGVSASVIYGLVYWITTLF